jgi:CIC family chloride channel protein
MPTAGQYTLLELEGVALAAAWLRPFFSGSIMENAKLDLKFLEHVGSLQTSAKWFLLSTLVGVVAGCGGILFNIAEQTVFRVTSQAVAGFSPHEAAGEHRLFSAPSTTFSPFKLLLVLAGGGLAAGWLVQRFAPEAEGHGTDAAIEAFHSGGGFIRPVVPLVKLVASAITIGTGGSGGREGPIAQIGAGFGSYLATALRLPVHDRRILLAAGMGAGIAAIFRAPLAGALFSAEILYRDSDLETEVVMPAAVSSIVGYCVFSYWLPEEVRFLPLFGSHLHHRLGSLVELLPMTLLACLLVLMGVLYIKTFYGLHHLWKKVPLPALLRPAAGAFLAGVVALAFYYATSGQPASLAVLGTGYGTLQRALVEPSALGWSMLIAVATLKIVTTSLTIGSGGSGGVFGPSMVIGGCTGGAVGELLHRLAPQLVPQPAVYAVIGMAGFFAGVAHAPISTIIMVTELTGDYSLLVPTMWVSTLCFVLCQRWTLYHKQLPSRLDSPAHRGDFLVDVLEGLSVRDVGWKQRKTVPEGMNLRELLQIVADTRQHYFPVLDNEGRLAGIFSTDDVRRYFLNQVIWELAIARDVMTTRVVTVTPEDDLNTALRRFTELNLDELPVVSCEAPTQLLGMLRRKDVISTYNRQLIAHKEEYQPAE